MNSLELDKKIYFLSFFAKIQSIKMKIVLYNTINSLSIKNIYNTSFKKNTPSLIST